MNVNLTLTNDYRKKDDFVIRIFKPNFFLDPDIKELIFILYPGTVLKRLSYRKEPG